MTVKLAKFFTNNSFGNGMVGSTTVPPPPAPMPTPISSMRLHSHYFQHQQQQQQHQQQRLNYNPYTVNERVVGTFVPHDDDELDNMSIYSGSNIMTSRNHPCNNSQRPLLADRKPPQLLVCQSAKYAKPQKHTFQPQQQQLKYTQTSVQPAQFQIKHIKSYLPAYVPQQKRDSAKGLHGFNDFDILSQQYNQHLLASPHIGYPYGSPPSPTANSSDFVFDTATISSNVVANPSNAIYGNLENYTNNEVDYQQQHQQQVSSCFEDDFCTTSSSRCKTPAGGPFVFGVPYEKQIGPESGALHHSTDSTDVQRHVKSMTQQSSSDTSSSSRDDSNKGVKKFLLRKRKSKKTISEKEKPKAETEIENKTRKPTIKCVVVGDGAVGKTNLILSYLENRFNTEHVPTASDIYNADVMVNESPVQLTLCDTAGQDTLDPLRELCYPDSDVFLLCFSVTKPETFQAIKTKWAPKFAKSKAALLLVGTQTDLRTNAKTLNKLQINGEKAVSYADAWELASSIGAKYIETSSATQEKVKEVFDTAIWEGLRPSSLPPTPSFWKKLFCLA